MSNSSQSLPVSQHMHCFLDKCTPFLIITLLWSSSSFDLVCHVFCPLVFLHVFPCVIPPSMCRSPSAPSPINLYYQRFVTDVVVFSPRPVAKLLQSSVFYERFSSGCLRVSFLMSLLLVWSLLHISTPTFQLNCFLPLHLSDSYYPIVDISL